MIKLPAMIVLLWKLDNEAGTGVEINRLTGELVVGAIADNEECLDLSKPHWTIDLDTGTLVPHNGAQNVY